MCRVCDIGVLVFKGVYVGVRVKVALGNKRQTVDISLDNLLRELNASDVRFLCDNCKQICIKRTKAGNFITDIELYRNVRVRELTNSASIKKVCKQLQELVESRAVEVAYSKC